MAEPRGESGHWMTEQTHRTGSRPDALARWSGWGFFVCALVAIGYGVGTLYGSGSRALAIDVTRELEGARGSSTDARLGPYKLDPAMNPMRFVLNASHAPLGASRRRYDLALEESAGGTLWRSAGALGSHDDVANLVITRTSLVTFDVPRAGEFWIRVRGSGSSMDDLRSATLELRRGVTRVDARIPWGFGIAAVLCLGANLLAAQRRSASRGTPEAEARRAA